MKQCRVLRLATPSRLAASPSLPVARALNHVQAQTILWRCPLTPILPGRVGLDRGRRKAVARPLSGRSAAYPCRLVLVPYPQKPRRGPVSPTSGCYLVALRCLAGGWANVTRAQGSSHLAGDNDAFRGHGVGSHDSLPNGRWSSSIHSRPSCPSAATNRGRPLASRGVNREALTAALLSRHGHVLGACR
jgi:hypothetical protein